MSKIRKYEIPMDKVYPVAVVGKTKDQALKYCKNNSIILSDKVRLVIDNYARLQDELDANE